MIFRWKIMSEGVSAAASVGRLALPTGAQRPLAGGPLMRAVRHASRAQPLES